MKTIDKIRWKWTQWMYRVKRKRALRKMLRRKKWACEQADKQTEVLNKRHYVMPDINGRYLVFNRKQLLAANKTLDPGQRKDFYDIIKEAVYITK